MRQSPEVLLLDDGELDDVQVMLDELGAAFGRVQGGAIAQKTPAPAKLLITPPPRIQSVTQPEPGCCSTASTAATSAATSPAYRWASRSPSAAACCRARRRWRISRAAVAG